MGPWEKYASQPKEGPWTKFGAQKAPQTSLIEQIGSGVSEGASRMLDFPGDMVRKGFDAIGLPIPPNPKIMGMEIPIVGGGGYAERTADPLISDTEPQTGGQRIGRRVGQDVGAGAVAAPLAGIATAGGLATSTLANATGGLAGGATSEVTDNPTYNMIATLLGNLGGIVGGNAVAKSASTKKAIDAVPSIDALKAEAGAGYEAGKATGTTAAGANTQSLAANIRSMADSRDLLDHAGVVSENYPEIRDVLKTIDKYSGNDMNPGKMRIVRETLQAAAQSTKPREARIGTEMLREFDNWVDNFAPQFREANKTYAKAMRGEEIDETIKIAATRPTNPDTAIKNEFANLHRSEIRGDLTYPDELVAAIEKASKGGAGRQIARGVGNLAPVPGNITRSGLGLGGIMGGAAASGGSAVAAGAAAGGAGLIARLLANNMAKGDARMASAIARNGGNLQIKETDAVKQLIAALLARSSAGSPAE